MSCGLNLRPPWAPQARGWTPPGMRPGRTAEQESPPSSQRGTRVTSGPGGSRCRAGGVSPDRFRRCPENTATESKWRWTWEATSPPRSPVSAMSEWHTQFWLWETTAALGPEESKPTAANFKILANSARLLFACVGFKFTASHTKKNTARPLQSI